MKLQMIHKEDTEVPFFFFLNLRMSPVYSQELIVMIATKNGWKN